MAATTTSPTNMSTTTLSHSQAAGTSHVSQAQGQRTAPGGSHPRSTQTTSPGLVTQSPVDNAPPPSGVTFNAPNVCQRNNQDRPLGNYCDTSQNQNSSPDSTETSSEETPLSSDPSVNETSSRFATHHPTEDTEEQIALTNQNCLQDMWGTHAHREHENTHCGEDEEHCDTSQGSHHQEELSDEQNIAPPQPHTPVKIAPDVTPSDPDMLQLTGLALADATLSVSERIRKASAPPGRVQDGTAMIAHTDTATQKTLKNSLQPTDNMGSIGDPPINHTPREPHLIFPRERHVTCSQSQQRLNRALNDDLANTQANTGRAHHSNKNMRKDLKSPTEDDGWNQTKKAKKK
jgi:hypothetical protein